MTTKEPLPGIPGRCDKIIFEMPIFELKEIESVYVGKPNRCMCGCSGKYSVLKINEKIADERRGYACPEDVNDKRVQRVYNKMIKNQNLGIDVIEDYIFTVVVGNTQYSLYLLRGSKNKNN